MFLPFSPGSVNFYLQAWANGFAEWSTGRVGPLPEGSPAQFTPLSQRKEVVGAGYVLEAGEGT